MPLSRLSAFFLEPEEDATSPGPEVPVPSSGSPVDEPDNSPQSGLSKTSGTPQVPAAPENGARTKPEKPSVIGRLASFFVDDDENQNSHSPDPVPSSVKAAEPVGSGENNPEGQLAGPSLPGENAADGVPPDNPSIVQKFLSIFQKPPEPDINSLVFNPGDLAFPSLEGALRDVNITYVVDNPFQYVHIEYSRSEGMMIYSVVEPQLSSNEEAALTIIENAFEKLVSTNAELIDATMREKYLHERFYSLIHIFGLKLTDNQKARMYFHLWKQYLGYGRIDTLMKDKYIEDISCNGSDMYLYVQHRTYGSVRTNVKFGEVELNNFVLKLAQISGRHVSLLQPIRDLTLPDGSRANITLGGEVTKKGSTFTIRKFRANPISSIELMEYGSIDAQQLAYLWILMEYKRSILVSGGTATGKTTFLNVLCSFIPPEYKIVSIEDTAELNLMHPNWIQSISRTGFGSSDGGGGASAVSGLGGGGSKAPGDISLYDLLVAALRQRPEFIIIGEVRGGEAFTLFQAIAVGHAALGTIHAGSMDELLARVESNPMNVPRSLLSNLDLVIFPMHIKKGERSMRRIANIVEILELDRDKGDLITNTVYKWVPDIDEFQWQGRSFLFDRIKDIYGVSKDILNEELKNRTDFILWMQKHDIREYHAVVKMIQLYYRDKDEVIRKVKEGGSITVNSEPELLPANV
ncbi:MAG: Flp pilus assembly complex ATPase component TadA [Methanoregula sp.]|jgi:flagellar protein FlaI|nr:Flp pilus assembly complex ATPase component TadA [Methanoregula sp.]